MEWMINTQLGRRNLPPQQRIAVVKKFERKIQEQAKLTQGTRTDLTSSPNGEKDNGTHTDKELAKMAGVGTGTVAGFNKVMNSDDENSKLRALISNNFGRRENDPEKDRKAIEKYASLCGYSNGQHGQKLVQNGLASQEEIAKQLGITTTELKRILRIERNLTDSMKELLDTGVITKTLASDTISSLSEEEQIR